MFLEKAGRQSAVLHIDKTGDNDGAGSVIKLSSNSDGCQSAIGHIQVDENDSDLFALIIQAHSEAFIFIKVVVQ